MDFTVSHLSKSFGEHTVLEDFSYTFSQGGCYGIMGESGCGKTTLFHLLMGLLSPSSGSISPPGRVGAVFQEDRLSENLSAVKNILLTCKRGFARQTAEEHLRQVGIKGDLSLPLCQFSGGMKRRVAIVRAVLFDSDILMMDEPFKGLDTETRQLVITYIQREKKGRTLLFTTHDQQEISLLAATQINLRSE